MDKTDRVFIAFSFVTIAVAIAFIIDKLGRIIELMEKMR